MEEKTLICAVDPKPFFQNLSPIQQLKEMKPKYDFEKAALTLQNSRSLLKNLEKLLYFLNSEQEYIVFSDVKGATETFFVEILKDKNNLLSNMLDENCKAVCKDIYDFLLANNDKFEVYIQLDKEEMALVYCKAIKCTSNPVKMPNKNNNQVQEILSKKKVKKMTKQEQEVQRYQDRITFLTKTFVITSLRRVLDFICDPTQVSLIFEDLDLGESEFIKSISVKCWKSKVAVLEHDCQILMQAIIKELKSKKNWTMLVTESKVKFKLLRDIKFEKKPNFMPSALRDINPLDILKEGVISNRPLQNNLKLRTDLSTPVVIDNALKIMKGMGWDGGGLGIRGNGITEPIMPCINRVSRSGLGLETGQKKAKKLKYVPTLFVLTVFENIQWLITSGGDDVTLSSHTDMTSRDRSYLNEVLIRLNNRDDSAVGVYGDKHTVSKILEAMIQDPSLRLVVHIIDKKHIKICRGRHLPAIPAYTPGSNVTEYVETLVRSFGSVCTNVKKVQENRKLEYLTVLLDLVLNDCETKTYISPKVFKKKDMLLIMNMVKHVNTRTKYGGGKMANIIFNLILENVKGYFLNVNFEVARSQQLSEVVQSNKMNSFTVKKIYDKQTSTYRNSGKQKPNEVSNIVDEKTNQNSTHDDTIVEYIFLDDQKSDEIDDLKCFDDFSNIYETNILDSPITKETDKNTKKVVNVEETEQTLKNDDLKDVDTSVLSTDTNDDVLAAINSLIDSDVDMISVRSFSNASPLPSIHNDDSSIDNNPKTNNISNNQNEIFLNADSNSTAKIHTETSNSHEPVKNCSYKAQNDDQSNIIDKETRTSVLSADDGKFTSEPSNSGNNKTSESPKTIKHNIKTNSLGDNAELLEKSLTDDDLTDYDDADDSLHVDSRIHNKNAKYNSPDEWDQLQQDIFNLRQVLENELMNTLINKAESEDQYKNLKCYKADFEKFDPTNQKLFVKTIKIVPLNYPNEAIDKKTVTKIQKLIMEAVSEMEQPLLKCHGVKDGALLYTCYKEESYKFLNKLLINTKTKILDAEIHERKPRVFMRCVNYLEFSHNEIFYNLELFNKNICTKQWKVERRWDNNNFSIFVIQMDANSFECIKNNGFCLFFGVDQAEFSVAWR
ncbi:hypothetical protein K1T71_014218 [Dendrolimus kikuchii]|uniref:Uncharacterized protein n=1 Tax=Dendrolimus kikuchii TaxID=765133 RepID=A0ACC1CFL6_9NEOP|nr:hypothetical protein K1T71_014218 [Dendrolimus kikuchii]